MAARGAVAVFAKQNAKQRERLAEKQRQYNKARKSAVATRIRKVCARGGAVRPPLTTWALARTTPFRCTAGQRATGRPLSSAGCCCHPVLPSNCVKWVPLVTCWHGNTLPWVLRAAALQLVHADGRRARAQVFKAVAELGEVKDEAALQPVERLISEAYKDIDKAVSKGIIHKNTAARRKSRLAAAKRNTLVQAGLYAPAGAAPATA